MYNVSNAYKIALKKPYKVRKITGSINNTVSFGDVNIAKGSLIISNQCSDNEELRIGTVFMGQMSCTFRGLDSLKGHWKGARITLSEGLRLENGTYEYVPLGVFTVEEANHQEDGVAVTAYDNMRLLDKKFGISTTVGTPYDYLRMISRDCGIALAQTEEQIRELPNGTKAYVLYSENDIETYRDLLSWVAQTVCTFATIDRQGKLELRRYKMQPVDTITAVDRFRGASFSDFVTFYTGISVVNIDKETTTYLGLPVDNGLTYNLGSNPLLQSGNIEQSLDAILNKLADIAYTPFELDRSGCPAYDLGDAIAFEDGNGEGCTGCLMSYEYTYHGTYNMEGFGKNPALATARSKTDKQIAGLMSKNSVANALQIYTYTNAMPLTIRDEYKRVMKIRFGSLKETRVTFHAEILCNVDANVDNVICTVRYLFNNVELDYHPVETWFDGDHLLHLMYVFAIETVQINVLDVQMKADGGVINIDRGFVNAYISGQGLAASDSWDGVIEFTEQIGEITFETTPSNVDDIEETVSVPTVIPFRPTFTEQVGAIEINNSLEVDEFDAYVYVNKRRLKDLTWGEVKNYTWGEILELFNW